MINELDILDFLETVYFLVEPLVENILPYILKSPNITLIQHKFEFNGETIQPFY